MKSSHHSQIPADVLADAQEAIDRANQLLKPYLIHLSVQERKKSLKLGDKTLAFVAKSYDFAKQYPDIVPPFIKMSDFAGDIADSSNLRALTLSCKELTTGLDDTAMAAGGEAYNTALIFYQAAKAATRQNVSGAKDVAKTLQEQFVSRKHRVAPSTTEAED
ncbi:MAG: hypothetical protein LBS41_03975 [Streptococcaceae bacterium]|jgi:hypothetical protein|nr:hypothetical protein [Streptococcaceae bacterium]